MPIGNRYRGEATGPGFSGQDFARSAGKAGEVEVAGDLWQHDTITAAELAPSGTVAVRRLPTPATRFKMLVIDSVRVLVRFGDQDAVSLVGNYDLYHPGGGELDESVPPFTRFTVLSEGALSYTVECWSLSGLYAIRPS